MERYLVIAFFKGFINRSFLRLALQNAEVEKHVARGRSLNNEKKREINYLQNDKKDDIGNRKS